MNSVGRGFLNNKIHYWRLHFKKLKNRRILKEKYSDFKISFLKAIFKLRFTKIGKSLHEANKPIKPVLRFHCNRYVFIVQGLPKFSGRSGLGWNVEIIESLLTILQYTVGCVYWPIPKIIKIRAKTIMTRTERTIASNKIHGTS